MEGEGGIEEGGEERVEEEGAGYSSSFCGGDWGCADEVGRVGVGEEREGEEYRGTGGRKTGREEEGGRGGREEEGAGEDGLGFSFFVFFGCSAFVSNCLDFFGDCKA